VIQTIDQWIGDSTFAHRAMAHRAEVIDAALQAQDPRQDVHR
jgi:hypothetical protein